jgi:hypothetical protein
MGSALAAIRLKMRPVERRKISDEEIIRAKHRAKNGGKWLVVSPLLERLVAEGKGFGFEIEAFFTFTLAERGLIEDLLRRSGCRPRDLGESDIGFCERFKSSQHRPCGAVRC